MDHKLAFTLFCLLPILASLPLTLSLKVGVLPMAGGSHPLSMDIITQQIIKRGHETVTIISNEPHILKKLKPSPLALFEVKNPLTSEDIIKMLSSKHPIYPLTQVYKLQASYCDAILSNKTLLQSIQDVDIIISDGLYFCGLLVPEVLNKSNIIISFSGGIFGFHTFLADYEPITYIPLHGSMIVSKKMTFIQRTINIIMGKIVTMIFGYVSANVINEQRLKHNISTHLTLNQLRRKFSLHLSTLDFSIEYTRPLPPYIHTVGPVTPKPASPLPKTFQDIIHKSNSIVLVSFGSELQLSDEKLPEMVTALGQLSHTVIWKTKQKVQDVPHNVKIMDWIPQNDILGNHKVVAFISHCGSNGLYEAAYHGVPMVAMPGMIEQQGNAARVMRAGMATYANFLEFQVSDVVKAVSELTENPSYKENAVRISKIIKSRSRSPVDTIVDWIEYVARTDGAHHLKVEGENLWFYEYYNLDVLVAVIVVLYAFIQLFKSCINTICSSNSKTKKD